MAVEDIATRRKRLRYRSWHRGSRETDLIFGPFADAHLEGFDAGQLDRYETLIEEQDADLYDWVSGRVRVPVAFATDVWFTLLRFTAERAR